jgi:hypothetical protein
LRIASGESNLLILGGNMSVDDVEIRKSDEERLNDFDIAFNNAIEAFEFEKIRRSFALLIDSRHCVCGELDLESGESIPCPYAALEEVRLYSDSDETVKMCHEHSLWSWNIGD